MILLLRKYRPIAWLVFLTASQALFMATILAPYFHGRIWVVLLLYAIALLVGITPMYAGAHYPRSVLAEAILGSAWGLLGVLVKGCILNGIG